MKKFYLTFGQKSPFKDGYVLVIAQDIEAARDEVFYVFGDKFAFLYEEEKFNPSYFPAGQYGVTLEA